MNYKKFIFYLFLVLISLEINKGKAEDIVSINRNKIGLILGGNYNLHKTDIPILWDTENCGKFVSGKSFGYNAGIFYSYNIISNLINADVRFIYGYLPARFTLEKSDYRVFNPDLNKYEYLQLKYDFTSDCAYLLFQPGLSLQPLKSLPLKIRLGMDIGNPIFNSKYSTSEEIISPKSYTFPDEKQKHNIQSGELTQAGTSLSAVGSMMVEKEITKNIFFGGEIYYQHPINSRLKDYEWSVNQVGLNLSLAYAFSMKSKPRPIPPPLETEKPKPVDTPLVVEIAPKNLEIELQSTPVRIKETTVTQTYPILPYIFFEKKSSEINPKYLKIEKDNFSEELVSNNTLDIYYSLLNIIALRLKNSPSSKITIAGMTDGTEMTDAEARKEIARNRANTVYDYFVKKWGINPKQINIVTKDIPELATSNAYPEGFEENRRVEIYSDDAKILSPVVHTKFKEYELLTDNIVFLLNSVDIDSVKNWSLKFEGNLLAGSENKPNEKLEIKINESFETRLMTLINKSEPLIFEFKAEGFGKSVNKSIIVPVEKEQNTFELQRLNLIVFDFDKYELNDMNRNMISNFVSNSIQDNSSIRIIGSTDRLGEKEYNMELSKERANTAYRYLKELKPNANYMEVKGVGDSDLLYDNDIPEGRFYCRTVLIEVKTPVNK